MNAWIETLTSEPGQLRPPQRGADQFIAMLDKMADNPSVQDDPEVSFPSTDIKSEPELGDLGPYNRGA
jgi:hypothetical protein